MFLVSHALVRTSLSQVAEVHPRVWRFRKNPHGRPEIDHPVSIPLRFSLSHTRELAACAISGAFDIGVDVETSGDSKDLMALAERFFAPREASALRALPIEKQIDHFYSIWTLKEAYVKARGLGLSLPLDCIAFQIDADRIEAKLEGESADEQNNWAFCLMRPTPQHWLAIAVKAGSAAPPRIDSRWLVPLKGRIPAAPCPIVAATHLG